MTIMTMSHVTNSISRTVMCATGFLLQWGHACNVTNSFTWQPPTPLIQRVCTYTWQCVISRFNVTNSFIEPLTQRMCTHIWRWVMSRTQCPKRMNVPNLQAAHVYFIWIYTDTHTINGSIACVYVSENEPRLTHARVTSQTQCLTCTRSHVTNSMPHMCESRHTPYMQRRGCVWLLSSIYVCERSSHVSRMNASCLTHRWVTSLTRISHVWFYSLLSTYHLIAIELITSCHELNVTNWQWLKSESIHCYPRITSMLSTSLSLTCATSLPLTCATSLPLTCATSLPLTSLPLTCAHINSTPTNTMSHMHVSRHELNATQSTFRTHSLRSLIRLED